MQFKGTNLAREGGVSCLVRPALWVIPEYEFVQLGDFVAGARCACAGEPGVWIDAAQLRCFNQAVLPGYL